MTKKLMMLIKFCVSIAATLILLSCFTLIYSHTGVHITNESGATDYVWEANQYRSNMTEGFSWIRMNDEGLNNLCDYSDVDHVDVLLLGSSHMEAVNVPNDKNTAYLMNQLMPDLYTYNIGVSGHTIYHCVKNLHDAIEYYNPTQFVVIETDTVQMDSRKMKLVLSGEFPSIPSHDEGVVYWIQKGIPCFLPLYREIVNWKNAENNSELSERFYEPTESLEDYSDSLYEFLDYVSETAEDRKVIIVYDPETIIDSEGGLTKEDEQTVKLFSEMCEKNNIVFIDMYSSFYECYEENGVLAHGFSNTAVGVGHLNEYGHILVAERVTSAIEEMKNGVE